MRKVVWTCDCCGFVKSDESYEKDDPLEEVFDGWAIIHKYENGVCSTVDLCPECSEQIKINNI